MVWLEGSVFGYLSEARIEPPTSVMAALVLPLVRGGFVNGSEERREAQTKERIYKGTGTNREGSIFSFLGHVSIYFLSFSLIHVS